MGTENLNKISGRLHFVGLMNMDCSVHSCSY